MADPPKQLGAGSLTKTATDDVIVVEVPGGGSITYSYSKNEWLIHQHQSVSPEAMMLGVQQANAEKEIAQARYAVPAQERTKQALIITGGLVVTIVAIVVGAVTAPAVAWPLAGMAAVFGVVFGSIWTRREKAKKSAPGNPTGPSSGAEED